MLTSNELEQAIIKLASENSNLIEEICIVGSRAKIDVIDSSNKRSDLDIFVLFHGDPDESNIYEHLSDLSIKYGILIHPVFIKKSEKLMKLKIKEYMEAYDAGRVIFKSK